MDSGAGRATKHFHDLGGRRPEDLDAGCRVERLVIGARRATVVAGPRPGESGSYIDQGKIIPSSRASYDTDREDELRTTAARLTGLDQET